MEIILLERIEKLGQMGDVVRVKDGFARNYLLPQRKALRATRANMERFEKERAMLEKRNAELKAGAKEAAKGIDGKRFVIIRQAGENGQLYGSVSTRDIATAASEAGAAVKRGQVILDHAIKQLGVHEVRIALHPEVTVTVSVNVARTAEEAERQARGEDVTAEPEAEEEAAIAPEEVFESEEQAREASEELAEAEEAAAEEAAAEETGEGETETAPAESAEEETSTRS